MKVLVTGANSLVGSNVIRVLLERGFAVRAFVRNSSEISTIAGLNCELFYGDITRQEDVDSAIHGCDYIIHAAARNISGPTKLEYYYKENVKAVEFVIKSCIKYQVKRLVYVSTANTIDPGDKDNPGTEENSIGKQYKKSGYAMSKFLAQELIRKYVLAGELNAVIVNPSFNIGPYDAKPTSGRIILMYYKKKLIFIPSRGKNFVYSKDVAIAICNALSRGRNGECYLLTHQNLTFLDFCRKLDEATDHRSIKIVIPDFVIKALGYIGTVIGWFGPTLDLNHVNAGLLCTSTNYSSGKAMGELGLPQTPIETAIRDAISWFKENGYLKT